MKHIRSLFMLCAIMLFAGFYLTSCGGDDENNDNNEALLPEEDDNDDTVDSNFTVNQFLGRWTDLTWEIANSEYIGTFTDTKANRGDGWYKGTFARLQNGGIRSSIDIHWKLGPGATIYIYEVDNDNDFYYDVRFESGGKKMIWENDTDVQIWEKTSN